MSIDDLCLGRFGFRSTGCPPTLGSALITLEHSATVYTFIIGVVML